MDKRIIEAIESCRPGSDDLRALVPAEVAQQVLQDPDALAAYQRAQQWDAKVVEAMQQVEPPVGLAARLLATLASQEPAAASATELPKSKDSLPSLAGALDAPLPKPEATVGLPAEVPAARWSRRQWVGTLTTVAAALVLAVVLNGVFSSGDDEPLAEMAQSWESSLDDNWLNLAQAPRGFAPVGIVGNPTGWQWIGKSTSSRGVAYRLQDRQGRVATLYVVLMDRPNEPSSAPQRPQSTTGGRAVGYWQHGGRVFVLVAQDEQSYRRFVPSSPAPFA